jgi:hypothetical protein
LVREETCTACETSLEKNHCYGCGVCLGKPHKSDCEYLICMGHEELGPMGTSGYCDGKCRPKIVSASNC